jgi:hypothetical protein
VPVAPAARAKAVRERLIGAGPSVGGEVCLTPLLPRIPPSRMQ